MLKRASYQTLSAVVGVIAAAGARKIISALWRGDADPPLNPADRRVSWREAVTWALATAAGAAAARLVAMRGAAAGWEKATGEPPPGIDPA